MTIPFPSPSRSWTRWEDELACWKGPTSLYPECLLYRQSQGHWLFPETDGIGMCSRSQRDETRRCAWQAVWLCIDQKDDIGRKSIPSRTYAYPGRRTSGWDNISRISFWKDLLWYLKHQSYGSVSSSRGKTNEIHSFLDKKKLQLEARQESMALGRRWNTSSAIHAMDSNLSSC